MALIEKSVEVHVPVRTAYNQWTQFEEFPKFMEGVTQVQQLDSTHLHWKAQIAGKDKEWNAAITEQHPDERIAWKSTDGAKRRRRHVSPSLRPDQQDHAADGL